MLIMISIRKMELFKVLKTILIKLLIILIMFLLNFMLHGVDIARKWLQNTYLLLKFTSFLSNLLPLWKLTLLLKANLVVNMELEDIQLLNSS